MPKIRVETHKISKNEITDVLTHSSAQRSTESYLKDKRLWTEKEDKILIQLYNEYGYCRVPLKCFPELLLKYGDNDIRRTLPGISQRVKRLKREGYINSVKNRYKLENRIPPPPDDYVPDDDDNDLPPPPDD